MTSPSELSEREVTSPSNLKVVGAQDNYSLVFVIFINFFGQLKDWVGQVLFLDSCPKGQVEKYVYVEAWSLSTHISNFDDIRQCWIFAVLWWPFWKWWLVEIFQCRDIIIYPHIKFWWYRTMLNFYRPFFMPCFGSHFENGRHLENFENAELLL